MKIEFATTEAEKQAIYQIRYDIYVEEMRVYTEKADHEKRIFTDSHDDTDLLLYAHDGSQVVAAMSLVDGSVAPMEEGLSSIYDLDRFTDILPKEKMSAFIRLVVKEELRSSTLPFRMMKATAEKAIANGAELFFCTCQPHLLKMYQRIGFRSYSNDLYNDPQFGIMIPLILVLSDHEYYQRIKSPFRKVFAKGHYQQDALTQILQVMGASTVYDTESDEGEEQWSSIYNVLNEEQTDQILFFDGLDESEIQQVIALGHVMECAPGDRVIKKGQPAKTVYVPLSGDLHVRNNEQLIALVQKGEMLGEQAFLLNQRRTVDVYAGNQGCQVLSLDERNLRTLIETPGRVAAILLLNMSKALAHRLAQTTAELQAQSES